ncbi:NS2 [St Croix River virus]|uniref:NS2 n=1 Tax=St Croix River virus TaxID=104581 RepID=Q9DSP3_9REOV|nr:NS2 [St Croix River virus]AAG34263.1 NS2 [St Croix River virus]
MSGAPSVRPEMWEPTSSSISVYLTLDASGDLFHPLLEKDSLTKIVLKEGLVRFERPSQLTPRSTIAIVATFGNYVTTVGRNVHLYLCVDRTRLQVSLFPRGDTTTPTSLCVPSTSRLVIPTSLILLELGASMLPRFATDRRHSIIRKRKSFSLFRSWLLSPRLRFPQGEETLGVTCPQPESTLQLETLMEPEVREKDTPVRLSSKKGTVSLDNPLPPLRSLRPPSPHLNDGDVERMSENIDKREKRKEKKEKKKKEKGHVSDHAPSSISLRPSSTSAAATDDFLSDPFTPVEFPSSESVTPEPPRDFFDGEDLPARPSVTPTSQTSLHSEAHVTSISDSPPFGFAHSSLPVPSKFTEMLKLRLSPSAPHHFGGDDLEFIPDLPQHLRAFAEKRGSSSPYLITAQPTETIKDYNLYTFQAGPNASWVPVWEKNNEGAYVFKGRGPASLVHLAKRGGGVTLFTT